MVIAALAEYRPESAWFQLLHMTREFIKCLLQRVMKLLLPLDHNDHFPETFCDQLSHEFLLVVLLVEYGLK